MSARLIRGPGELIAAIPTILGYMPQESVVVVGLGHGGEVVAIMRADRSDLLVDDLAADLHDRMRARLRLERVDRAVLVSFTGDQVPLGCPAADALALALESVVDRIDAWTCDGGSYRVPGCADPGCCPAAGTPVPWDAVAAPTDLVPGERSTRWREDSRDEPRDAADPRDRRRAARAGDRWWAKRDSEDWRRRSLAMVLTSIQDRQDVLALGRAAVALRDVRVRDGLIVRWLGGDDRAVDDVLEGRATEQVAHVLDGALRDARRAGPDAADSWSAWLWCLTVAAHARRHDRAAVHAVQAVARWWAGDVRGAARSADAALGCDPGYTLAGLIADVCAAGLAPAWSLPGGAAAG